LEGLSVPLHFFSGNNMNKNPDSVDEFDFGFSFVDEDIAVIQQEHQNSIEETKDLEARLGLMYKTILPFLDNLCKNPEKSTIHWPNRVEKIEKFKQKLQQIMEGKQ
jgi:hypothetical protein